MCQPKTGFFLAASRDRSDVYVTTAMRREVHTAMRMLWHPDLTQPPHGLLCVELLCIVLAALRKQCVCAHRNRNSDMCALLKPCAAAATDAGNAHENAPLSQSITWQYARPKCDGGPLQQHLDAFKGYKRFATYL